MKPTGPLISTNKYPLRRTLLAAASILLTFGGEATWSAGSMEADFKNPPDTAKPRVWWHWLKGNVTEPGITADLEWMHRVGIGGFHMFDGDMGSEVYVEKPVIWMTPEWKSALRHAASEADRLHLEMGMAFSGGWSESGGPWVKPSQGMKKYVWSEMVVNGPGPFTGTLPPLPSAVGQFQDSPDASGHSGFHADAAVEAFPAPEEEGNGSGQKPAITTSGEVGDLSVLQDGSFAKSVEITSSKENPKAWVQFAYARPQTVQAVQIAPKIRTGIPQGQLQVSDDGRQWRTVLDLSTSIGLGPGRFPVRTFSIPATTARFFRVLFDTPSINLTEVQLLAEPRLQDWENKALFGIPSNPMPAIGAEVQPGEAIDPARVIDLTSKLKPDGTLDWTVPKGKWIVLRLGYSLTGKKNHPATKEATGLEVDKLSKQDVRAYVEEYGKMISEAVAPWFGKSFQYFLFDSWEAGMENWTEEMLSEFKIRRGYPMNSYLPVLTGRIVGSRAKSEGVLWDFRRTLAEMVADNHFGVAADYCKEKGIGLYGEASGTYAESGDGLLNKGKVTIPMGEFWTPGPRHKPRPEHEADVRDTSSAAHIYGKPLAATESFTTSGVGWSQSPFYLKSLADVAFSRGINRIVVHTSDHQPFVDDQHKPGMTLGPFGQHYSRNITWAEQSVAWNRYLARCSHMLQQGAPFSDVAYFYGEGAPVKAPFWKKVDPAQPTQFDFDYVNADVLLHGATAKPGALKLSSGMSYRLLVLPNDLHQMSLPLLRRIHTLVGEGAVLLGPKPEGSPSLGDGEQAKAEVKKLADELWGDSASRPNGHAFGKGKVFEGKSIEDVLAAEGILPDLAWSTPQNVGTDIAYPLPAGDSDQDVVFIHRTDGPRDIYFVATPKHHPFDTEVSFRVTGKAPRLWHPDTGEIEPTSYRFEKGQTIIPMHFEPQDSVFVIFEGDAEKTSLSLPANSMKTLATINGPWLLTFPENWGAPPEIEFPALASWTANENTGVKYFSGTSTYHKQIEASPEWFKDDAKLWLDLGKVREIAEVTLNGKPVGGILWKPPFKVDVSGLLKPGSNQLEIKVTNLWPNRMIGDMQPGVAKTFTWTDYKAFKADSPLIESGLLGPVTIRSTEVIK